MNNKLVLNLNRPGRNSKITNWPGLINCSASLALAELVDSYNGLLVVIVADFTAAFILETELKAFLPQEQHDLVLHFPDWEILPYDNFSPHEDIISARLTTLHQVSRQKSGILIVPISTVLHRICPQQFLLQNTLLLSVGEEINLTSFRLRLQNSGYQFVSHVSEHGEFTIRGSILDLYPMGGELPYRIDLLDDKIDSIRSFDPETQRSLAKVDAIRLLPAKEFPLSEEAITEFRNNWRLEFNGDPRNCQVYQEVSKGMLPPGLEYYLPLFFANTATLFDYLPSNTIIVRYKDIAATAENFWQEIRQRYEQYRHDVSRPILFPNKVFIAVDEFFHLLKDFPQVLIENDPVAEDDKKDLVCNLPDLTLDLASKTPVSKIENLLAVGNRVLLCAETNGRKAILLELLVKHDLQPVAVASWAEFLNSKHKLCISTMPLNSGILLATHNIALITEFDMFGNKVMQTRRRKAKASESTTAQHDLAMLELGTPVVHIEHGVGRYLGLQTLDFNEQEGEFVVLEYANNAKLYVPVAALHLINRYSGVDLEHAPLHSLGSNKWQKDKAKALEQIRDVAAELLEIYAQRKLRQGQAFVSPDLQYDAFVAKFPFEETLDQEQAITEVIQDLTAPQPMDRVICGDVGFGKTEVAMRAAFLCVQAGKQVAVLVPTTLLAQQHYQTFVDRFADFPIKIEVVSRFKTNKEQEKIFADVQAGKCDIVIGTHKILSQTLKFKDLGLLIIDEEHRFGVRQKERFKAMRAEVNILTLTATPIPRTLNMAMIRLRDLSIIGTPPAKRLSVKTFVREYNIALIQEAIARELRRGGQVYYLHNEVESIEKAALELQNIMPQASIAIAHGQMPERELEKIMTNFYHRRRNVLVCTTIIESGIDVPTANTIIIARADKLGLAQLHQLRGRVGRSHHQAYAFCLTPPQALISKDAVKRLDAIASLDSLGAGFTLATHDLEIRGAGELLGEEQSGNMQAVGFSLYMELLEYAVKSLQTGKTLALDQALPTGIEIDLQMPALIPNVYLADVSTRLVQYKRIAIAKSSQQLAELKVEMIDRFGILPWQTQNLFALAELKLTCEQLGINKIKLGPKSGLIEFNANPNVEPAKIIQLIQSNPKCYKLQGPQAIKLQIELSSAKERLEFVEKLLALLAGK